MQRETKAELQMLRELVWHWGTTIVCYFCHKPLVEPQIGMTFGHRRHPPIDRKLTIHHIDHNRENNDRFNRAPSHQSCHRQYHANLRRSSEPELDEPSDS